MDGLTLLVLILLALLGLFLFFKVLKFVGKIVFTLILLAGVAFFWAKFHPQSFHAFYLHIKGFLR